MFCNPPPPPPPLLLPGGKRDLIWHHDWPLKKAIVCLQIKMEGNWKLTSCNSLSLLGTQKKDMVMGVGRVGAHSNWNRAVLLSLPQSASATKVFSSKVSSSHLWQILHSERPSIVYVVMLVNFVALYVFVEWGPVYMEKSCPRKKIHPPSLVSFCDPLLTLCPCQKLRHFARACSNCLALIELSQRALQSVLARAGEWPYMYHRSRVT